MNLETTLFSKVFQDNDFLKFFTKENYNKIIELAKPEFYVPKFIKEKVESSYTITYYKVKDIVALVFKPKFNTVEAIDDIYCSLEERHSISNEIFFLIHDEHLPEETYSIIPIKDKGFDFAGVMSQVHYLFLKDLLVHKNSMFFYPIELDKVTLPEKCKSIKDVIKDLYEKNVYSSFLDKKEITIYTIANGFKSMVGENTNNIILKDVKVDNKNNELFLCIEDKNIAKKYTLGFKFLNNVLTAELIFSKKKTRIPLEEVLGIKYMIYLVETILTKPTSIAIPMLTQLKEKRLEIRELINSELKKNASDAEEDSSTAEEDSSTAEEEE